MYMTCQQVIFKVFSKKVFLIMFSESQLAGSIMVARKRRGTEHYDHSYDHEHAAGFPSIEGALMAISFLTFAVYLVRLVMVISYL